MYEYKLSTFSRAINLLVKLFSMFNTNKFLIVTYSG